MANLGDRSYDDLVPHAGGGKAAQAILESLWPLVGDGRWHRLAVLANKKAVVAAIPPELAQRALLDAGDGADRWHHSHAGRMAILSALLDALGFEGQGRDDQRKYRVPPPPDWRLGLG
jgi:hypothetical protein